MLIGNHSNELITRFLQTSVNPFDSIFDSFNRKIDKKEGDDKTSKYQLSGYDLKPSII